MRVLLSSFLTLFVCAFAATVVADEHTTTYELDIEAQALPGALKSFAEQTDLQVVYFAAVAEGKDAPALEGEFTADAALDQLLANADLEVQNVDARTYSIAPVADPSDERGASDSKNLETLTPMPTAQNQTSQTQATSRKAAETATGTIRGTLTDPATGATLKGALVTLLRTGETTRSDDSGNFRFFGVPVGAQTIQVSYLGSTRATVSIEVRAGDDNQVNIAHSDSIDEILVLGTRSARALSLNLQRTAPNNSEVVSSDLLGTFEGSTISEALRRVPGVTFQQSTRTGEGTNVMVRGLAPNMNTVTLNGLRIPDHTGRGRSGSLSGILADSVSKITVNKSLLPSHDSSGTGGLIEIETKSPLDRPKRYFNVSVEGGQSADDFNDDLLASGTLSGTFGADDQFGLSASVQQRERQFETIRISQSFRSSLGQYLPLEADGSTSITNHSQIDPRRRFPFEAGATNIYPGTVRFFNDRIETSNVTASLSAEWQVTPTTNLRLDAQHIDAEENTQVEDSITGFASRYRLNPVVGLGGEQRLTYTYLNAAVLSRTHDFQMLNVENDQG